MRRRTTVGVVAIAYYLSEDRLGFGILALSDALFRQGYSALAKALDCVVVCFSRDHCVREIRDRCPKLFMRQCEILRLHRGFAAHESCFTLRYRGLPPLNFPIGDSLEILAKAAQANKALRKSDETGEKQAAKEG